MKGKFSMTEVRDIVISMAVLCFLFSYPEVLSAPAFFLTSLLAVGIAFMGHELSHKFAAIREGYWSEYRMWPQGLAMAALLALATGGAFIFAAPGAVQFSPGMFQRMPDRRQLRRISMAGITFNVALMWACLALFAATGLSMLSYMATINGWLAIFNLLPFGMLDGEKLFRLDKRTWSALLAVAAAGFVIAQIA